MAKRPATIVESGPASGVIGAAYVGRALGIANVLSFDMGGTTAKAGTVFDGEPEVAGEFEAAGRTHSGRAVKGSGYPVRFPFVDLAEVSAGGGTIAWIDAGGALRVGPLSAGADPGPAAYGKGTVPTVTDANIVLGRLNPHALLDGAMPIDAARSHRAIEALLPHLGGLDIDRAAAGILALVDNEMAKILRIVSIERGYDPRTFTMIAFGGNGPLHACSLARSLEIGRAIVPPSPGLFSAWGLLVADVRASYVRTLIEDASSIEPQRIEDAFAGMQSAGAAELAAQSVADNDAAFVRELEMRYLGQGYELAVAASAPFDATALADAVRAFHDKHERTYGYASRDEAVEIVVARLVAVGAVSKPAQVAAPLADGEPPAPPTGFRDTYFDGEGRVKTPVYRRERLRTGDRIAGPAIVEEYDSVTLVLPGWYAEADAFANLHLVDERTPA